MPVRTPGWDLQEDSQLNRLFNTVDENQQQNRPMVGKGSIIAFNYVGQTRRRIHDPYPLVLVSDVFSDMIRGVNLHYLTLPYVQNMVTTLANNPRFSYAFIKDDAYIVGAFRSYKRNGISQIRMLDTVFLRNLLTVVRALDVGEIEQIRHQIQDRLQAELRQPPAQPGPEIS